MKLDKVENLITINVHDRLASRLDAFLAGELENLSRSKIHALIRSGNITVNHTVVKPSYRLVSGDIVSVQLPEPEPLALSAEAMPLDIIYEDEDYFAVNKPKGLVVHPGAGNFRGTLVAGLLNYTRQLSSVGGDLRPGLVHRLDKDTTGVLVVAKTDEAHWKLGKLFADRQVYKEYRALVWGVPHPAEGIIEKSIGRNQRDRKIFTISSRGKPARSRYTLLKDFGIMSLVKVILETGRTHQIRVHMKHIGHPVVGDNMYGYKNSPHLLESFSKKHLDIGKQVIARVDRQMLHAYCLKFIHPYTGKEIEIIAPIPADILEIETILTGVS